MRQQSTSPEQIDVVDAADDYVSVPEAATLLQVSPSTVWRWIARGDLPAYRIGHRRVRLKRRELGRVVRPVETTDRRSKPSKGAATPQLTLADPHHIWAGYDQDAAPQALRQHAGSLAECDADRLIEQIYRARESGSRPATRP